MKKLISYLIISISISVSATETEFQKNLDSGTGVIYNVAFKGDYNYDTGEFRIVNIGIQNRDFYYTLVGTYFIGPGKLSFEVKDHNLSIMFKDSLGNVSEKILTPDFAEIKCITLENKVRACIKRTSLPFRGSNNTFIRFYDLTQPYNVCGHKDSIDYLYTDAAPREILKNKKFDGSYASSEFDAIKKMNFVKINGRDLLEVEGVDGVYLGKADSEGNKQAYINHKVTKEYYDVEKIKLLQFHGRSCGNDGLPGNGFGE